MRALLFVACFAVQDKPEQVPFTVILKHWGAPAPREAVMTDPKEWEALLRAQPDRKGSPPTPPVDFKTEALVMVAIGPQPNPGYGVSISRIEKSAEAITVCVKRTLPDPEKKYATVVVSPSVIVKIPKPDRKVVFVQVKD